MQITLGNWNLALSLSHEEDLEHFESTIDAEEYGHMLDVRQAEDDLERLKAGIKVWSR